MVGVSVAFRGMARRARTVPAAVSAAVQALQPQQQRHLLSRTMQHSHHQPLVLARTVTSNGYVQETRIPTYHFQDSLPKLPIPKLEKTLDRFLASAKPVVSAEQYAEAEAAVASFKADQGPALQAELEKRNKAKYSSYISEPWFDMYLSNRDPLPINLNPQMTWKDHDKPEFNELVPRAAACILASARVFRTVRDDQLSPEIFHMQPNRTKTAWFETFISKVPRKVAWYAAFAFKAFALDMSQYKNLFQSTRIPHLGKDELKKFPNSRHVVVQWGSDFFTFDIINEDGTAVEPEVIVANLESIVALPPSDNPPIGVLTTAERDAWANAREHLLTSDVNKSSIDAIDSALFAVCLEHEKPVTLHDIGRCMLHGNGRNRWFDKSFQLIVCSNGKTAVNFEHAWGDGVAVLRYMNEVYDDMKEQPLLTSNGVKQEATKLDFDIDSSTQAAISDAGKAFDDFVDSVVVNVLETTTVTSRLLKDLKLSPDGTLQMSFQLAYYRMFGHSASTYESAATAGFKHGRTETIRSATVASDNFCKTFTDPEASVDDRQKALKAAIDNHGAITKEALTGHGWDRHLFALRLLAEDAHPDTTLDLFSCDAYNVLKEIILSTSTLSSEALDGGGFGPVGERCFGIGYGVRDQGARFVVSSFGLDNDRFLNELHQALKDMRATAEGKNINV
eukprot:m.481687 g.481687  ORF g.481687 m.481687 type:complete len:677 (-) comp22284_c0_seq1:23-2053(-)